VHSTQIHVGDMILAKGEDHELPYIAQVIRVFEELEGGQPTESSPLMTLRWFYRKEDLLERFGGEIPGRILPKSLQIEVRRPGLQRLVRAITLLAHSIPSSPAFPAYYWYDKLN